MGKGERGLVVREFEKYLGRKKVLNKLGVGKIWYLIIVGPEGGAERADGLFAAFTEVLQWGVVGDAESDLWDER
jgi:hypothetical protein